MGSCNKIMKTGKTRLVKMKIRSVVSTVLDKMHFRHGQPKEETRSTNRLTEVFGLDCPDHKSPQKIHNVQKGEF